MDIHRVYKEIITEVLPLVLTNSIEVRKFLTSSDQIGISFTREEILDIYIKIEKDKINIYLWSEFIKKNISSTYELSFLSSQKFIKYLRQKILPLYL